MTKIKNEQFGANAYTWVAGSMILQSLLSAPAVAFMGFLSQPHRLGRRAVMLLLSMCSVVSIGVPLITLNAYTIVATQTLMSCFAAGAVPAGMLQILFAWTTDWCQMEDKMKYFGLLCGGLLGATALSPFIPIMLGIRTDAGLCTLAAGIKLASPLFIASVFPKGVPSLRPLTPASLTRRFSASPALSDSGNGLSGSGAGFCAKAYAKICAALKYLFGTRCLATTVYIMVNFCDAAVQDTVGIFLMRVVGVTQHELIAFLVVGWASGFVVQCLLTPAFSSCGVDPRNLLLAGLFSMVFFFGAYAFVTNPLVLLAMMPVGSFGIVSVLATQAIISGASSESEVPRDQGVLMGVLGGLKLLASCVGPLVLVGCANSWRSFPPCLRFPGVGFAFLSLFMIVALAFAVLLRRQKPRSTS